MLIQILSLLIEVAFGLLTGACLLRLYMQHQRIPMNARSGNPLGGFIFALTDWLVLPLRRVIPAIGRVDTASAAAAYLLQLVQSCILWLIGASSGSLGALAFLAALGLVRMALTGMTGLVIVYAVLSWVQSQSPLSDLMERLVSPLLVPIRRKLPLVGGIDLSPLVLLVLLQIGVILLNGVQAGLLGLL